MDLIEKLAAIPLFEGLSRRDYEELAAIVVDQNIGRRKMIFSEGDEGTGLFIVVSGHVKVFKLSPEGKEQTLHIIGPGEPFGEVAVFTGRPFPAHAQTIGESRVFFFPRNAFARLIARYPSIAMNMLAVLSRRLRIFAALVENLALKEVPGRLAAYILIQSERRKGSANLDLDISKNQLASLLGTIPETLSRILARMGREKLIKAAGRHIQILDRRRLQEVASGETHLA